jgi:hypothetical protein
MAVSGGTALRLLPLDAATVPEETIEVIVELLAARASVRTLDPPRKAGVSGTTLPLLGGGSHG